ncbi:hypothetical protein [Sporosarcina newyorkensis]|uniref:Uncharacterized protein n=1 Tax=Sporosarcina newyorkensis TaxID=759851 RepID=A0A1T4XMM8_9BACL|nr:hypothetical protein [Sporosarcina newyorkensis]SKA90345.1 hypothetical protein SAMN04244570_0957 [Sporosarcina newyorkensis]
MDYFRVFIYMCILGIFLPSQMSFTEIEEEVAFLTHNDNYPNSQDLGRAGSDEGLKNALKTIIPEQPDYTLIYDT